MTAAEEAVRATTQAIASTVSEVPALRLQAAPDKPGFSGRRPRGPRRAGRLPGWLVPVTAAVAVIAVAIALVLIRNIPNERMTSPSPSATSATTVRPPGAAELPEYYVAWMQAERPYLVVGSTLTGKQLGMIPSPSGIYLDAVYGGSADDRTWVVQGTHVPGPGVVTEWYLLTIAPGTENPVQMHTLAIPVRQSPAGAALSPDGKEVAVAVSGSPATLRTYSVVTGALLRTWSAPSGQFAAIKATAGSWQFTQLTLRWTADSRQVAFAWDAREIRTVDATAPDGSLLGSSKALAAIGVTYTTGANFTCTAWQGWEPITVTRGPSAGRGVICGGSVLETMPQISYGTASPSPGSTAGNATCTARKQPSVSFVESTQNSQGGGYQGSTASETECPGTAALGDGAYIGWSNADGSVVIGSLVWDGHVRFGIFSSHQRFSPLPKLPVSMPVPNGMLTGTDAW